jgi:aldose 1-epimerase
VTAPPWPAEDGAPLVLRAGRATLTIDPALGGRFSSLTVGGNEVLVTEGARPIWWGCYPMVPFAGRIRDGRFTFAGRVHQLERNLPPHAIHGTVFDRPWRVVSRGPDSATLAVDLGPGWPFAGRVRHAISLEPSGLEATLTLEAEEKMPAWIGWHPWFRRRVGDAPVELEFEASSMYVRGVDGLPTGARSRPGTRPWDDAFTGLSAAPRLRWPGVLELEITSAAEVWVVFDEREEGVCVEPQTAPPDAINLAEAEGAAPPTAGPGRALSASMAFRWSVNA